MRRRFAVITFPHLITDWLSIRQPHLRQIPVVVCAPSRGRLIITAVNEIALKQNIQTGMVLADARAIMPSVHVINEQPDLVNKILKKIAHWCIRYTPCSAVDHPDSIILDVTGCTHLWGGDKQYLERIVQRLKDYGYHVRAAIADTIGAAWGVARYSVYPVVVPADGQVEALLQMPPSALRLDNEMVEQFYKLGFRRIADFINLPERVLFRRFGVDFIKRLRQMLGSADEEIVPVEEIEIMNERLPCIEPISTASGIHIALDKLVSAICIRLRNENLGLRKAVFKCFRIDNKVVQVEIGTASASSNPKHILKLLEEKIETIEPGLGIELFILEVPKTEKHLARQDKIWESSGAINDPRLSELVDRLTSKLGNRIYRFVQDEHYWPERSFRKIDSYTGQIETKWRSSLRPVHLLNRPVKIQVTAPIPDYPPMLFRHQGSLHKIVRADGPERIEQEWWIEDGEHRDYYYVEDERGCRYWLFRSGHYNAEKKAEWFLHGYFA